MRGSHQPRHLAPTASDPVSWRAAFPRDIYYSYIYQPKMPFVKQPLRCRSHGPSRENRFSSPTRHSEALRPACGRWIARSGHPEKPHGQCPRKKTRNWASQSGRLMPEGLGAFDLLIFDNPTRHDDCPSLHGSVLLERGSGQSRSPREGILFAWEDGSFAT